MPRVEASIWRHRSPGSERSSQPAPAGPIGQGGTPVGPPSRGSGLRVRLQCGPLEPPEREALMGALLQVSEGDSWPEIHPGLLQAHASTRVHLLARRLRESIPARGLEGIVALPNQELALECYVTQLKGLGRVARDLQELQTPYRISIAADSLHSGCVQASWDLGLEGASVALRGEVPGDPGWRRRLLRQMQTLLLGGWEPRPPRRDDPTRGRSTAAPAPAMAAVSTNLDTAAPHGGSESSGPPVSAPHRAMAQVGDA